MFDFLKKGIKNAFVKFKEKDVDKDSSTQENIESHDALDDMSKRADNVNDSSEEENKSLKNKKEKLNVSSEKEEKKSKSKINEKEFDRLFDNFEMALLQSNVAYSVIEKIKAKLFEDLQNKKGKLSKIFLSSLKETILGIVSQGKIDIFRMINEKKKTNDPFVILFVGVNGTGKTTTIAKVAKLLMDKKYSLVVSASDTFRAASIEQLKYHCDSLGVRMIQHNYGSDPSAVAFDAIAHARSKSIDVVLIDSAGRLHTNVNLMKELEKLKRVSKPDLTLLVVDAVTGNDAVDQAEKFSELGISGVVVSKSDIDENGGVILSLCETLNKPIVFLGKGQGYDDIELFDEQKYVDELFNEI